MKCYILYNPLAGQGNPEGTEWLNAWTAEHGESELRDITQIQDYPAFFSAMESDDWIILCGGDGTLNRFINATDGLEIEQTLLYYANGTGNDFLHDVGLSKGAEPFPLRAYIRELPFVEVKGKRYRFLNNVGFGIDGYCCEVGDAMKEKNAHAKGKTKPVNYTAIAIKGLLFHYKPTNATVTVDGQEYRYEKVWLAPTMKGRFYGGGMMPTPKQDRNAPSHELSVMVFYGKGRLKTLMAFPGIFKGEHVKHTDMVAIHAGSDIHVIFDHPAAVQIDGETVLGVTEYRAWA